MADDFREVSWNVLSKISNIRFIFGPEFGFVGYLSSTDFHL